MPPWLPGYWQELRSPEFEALDPERTVALLPVGAVEQHGPHLPVMVDAGLNQAIVERALGLLPEGTPVLVLPMTSYGKSDEHRDFRGTLTLSAETLGRVWHEIGVSVRRAGVRKLLFLNSHGGQPQVMQIAAAGCASSRACWRSRPTGSPGACRPASSPRPRSGTVSTPGRSRPR